MKISAFLQKVGTLFKIALKTSTIIAYLVKKGRAKNYWTLAKKKNHMTLSLPQSKF